MRSRLVSAFLILWLGLSGGALAQSPAGTLRFGILPIADALPFLIIEERRLDRQHGFTFEVSRFGSAMERDSALQSGAVDGIINDLVGSTLLKTKGVDVAVVSLLLGAVGEEGPIYLLASPRSGLRDFRDLKGVPIGISSNTLIEYVTDRLLWARGFRPEEVQKVEVKQIPLRFQMLITDQIRAATLPDPLATLAISRGAIPLLSDIQENLSQSVTVFTGRAIREKRETLKAYARAYNAAVEAINRDPESWKDLLVRKAQLPGPVRESYRVTPFPKIRLPDREQVEAVVSWGARKGILSSPVTFENLTHPVLLE